MKSIMHEASSIFKAIEQGWEKAGKPKEFTVKVFEEPQHNFFGMTTRSAKIGIFFEEPKAEKAVRPTIQKSSKAARPLPESKREQRPAKEERRQPAAEKPRQHMPVAPAKESIAEAAEKKPKHDQPIWTPEMVEEVRATLSNTLNLMNTQVPFSISTQHFYLKIMFDKPIYDDKTREKHLFSSFATLFLQLLKNRYRRPLKGYKIVLQTL